MNFFFVVVDGPQIDESGDIPLIATTIPSVVARDADGNVLAAFNEPF